MWLSRERAHARALCARKNQGILLKKLQMDVLEVHKSTGSGRHFLPLFAQTRPPLFAAFSLDSLPVGVPAFRLGASLFAVFLPFSPAFAQRVGSWVSSSTTSSWVSIRLGVGPSVVRPARALEALEHIGLSQEEGFVTVWRC